jgi:hypothetical protein
MNRRVDHDKERLFAALEMFVNTGDTADELRAFRRQHQQFLSAEFYDRSEKLASGGKDSLFNWYKRLLRDVWEHRDPEGTRLAVLLGLRETNYYGPVGEDFAAEAMERMGILNAMREKQYGGGFDMGLFPSFPPKIVPDWRTGVFQYKCASEFQRAVYELMHDSWKARRCLVQKCGKYMIAAKPASLYCSTKCYGEAKRERGKEWWRENRGKKERVDARL